MHRGRWQSFQSCIVKKDSPDYKFNVRHIFPFANAVTAHNQNVFHQIHEYRVTIEAQDAVCGNPSEEEQRIAYYDLLTKIKMK